MNNNENEPQKKSKRTGKQIFLDVLAGLGASIIPWVIIIISLIQGKQQLIIVDFVVIGLVMFLSIRWLRRGYRVSGIIALIILSPLVLGLILFGACFISLSGNI